MLSKKIAKAYFDLVETGFCWVDNRDELEEIFEHAQDNSFEVDSFDGRDEASNYAIRIKVVLLSG